MKLSGVSFFFDNTRKNVQLNLALVLVLVLKSKAPYLFLQKNDLKRKLFTDNIRPAERTEIPFLDESTVILLVLAYY